MRRTSSRSIAERGLTLIELAVVITIIAILISVAVPAFKAATDADLKTTAVNISGAARMCFGEAAVKNVTLRLAYDLDKNVWWIEAYPGTYQIMGSEQDLDEFRDKEKEKDEDAKRKKEMEDHFGKASEDQAAQANEPVPKFVPVKIAFAEPQQLPRGVKFDGIRTPQFRQPIKDGKAYTHFFPNGWAERTLVYLKDSGGATITLEMEPLTGRVILHDGELDYREVDDLHEKEDR
jgi:prepilin-type N-terminal cleavage/methylation domain-containing protein